MSVPGKQARRIPLTSQPTNKYRLGKAPPQIGRNIMFAGLGILASGLAVWALLKVALK